MVTTWSLRPDRRTNRGPHFSLPLDPCHARQFVTACSGPVRRTDAKVSQGKAHILGVAHPNARCVHGVRAAARGFECPMQSTPGHEAARRGARPRQLTLQSCTPPLTAAPGPISGRRLHTSPRPHHHVRKQSRNHSSNNTQYARRQWRDH